MQNHHKRIFVYCAYLKLPFKSSTYFIRKIHYFSTWKGGKFRQPLIQYYSIISRINLNTRVWKLPRGEGERGAIFPRSPSSSASRSRERQWERNPLPTLLRSLAKRRLQWPETAIKRFVGRGWAVSSLLSPPRPACPHFSPARDFIRPQCREIKPFWDIYEWIGPSRATEQKGTTTQPAPSLFASSRTICDSLSN